MIEVVVEIFGGRRLQKLLFPSSSTTFVVLQVSSVFMHR